MAVRAEENIRHNGKEYLPGQVIENIKPEEAQRLIRLGVASSATTNPVDLDPPPGQSSKDEMTGDNYTGLLDKTFELDELKAAAKEVDVEFSGNIGKPKLIERIIEEGKQEEVLALAEKSDD